jgi:dTDP-6-deoxy-L-talose 4-dehydrogenase (NAD+)
MAATRRLILLTGATGFVGRQVLRALDERDCRTRLVIRDGKRDSIAPGDPTEGVLASADIFAEDVDWWRQACRGVDTVIHVAWYAEPGHYLHSPKNSDCVSGTLRLAQAAVAEGVRRFVGIGTCFEYDLSVGHLSETTALKPSTPYAQAKAATFTALSDLFAGRGVEFVWCRLFYLFGEREDPRRLVPYIRAQLAAGAPAELSGGGQIRDYLDVREAGRMIADAAFGTAQGPLNICSGEPITVRTLAERIADEYGRRDLLRFGARRDNPTDPPLVIGVRSAR